jgi:hypothetical protein
MEAIEEDSVHFGFGMRNLDGHGRTRGDVRAAIDARHTAARQKVIDSKTADSVTGLGWSDHRGLPLMRACVERRFYFAKGNF